MLFFLFKGDLWPWPLLTVAVDVGFPSYQGQGGTVVSALDFRANGRGSSPTCGILVKGDFSPGVDICTDSTPHSPSDET